MIIIVTGSVGTGKTTIAKALAKNLKANYLDAGEMKKSKKLHSRYNPKLDTYEVDVDKLNKLLIELIKTTKGNLIIDSHLSHYLPSRYVDYCIVCKTDLKVLKKRLEKREYSKIKIRVNLDSEIFDVCLIEAIENKHKVIVVDTTNRRGNSCVKELLSKID